MTYSNTKYKLPNCLLERECVWFIHAVKYYLVITLNKLEQCVSAEIDLKNNVKRKILDEKALVLHDTFVYTRVLSEYPVISAFLLEPKTKNIS